MRLKPELGIMIKIALAVGTFLTSYGIVHADEVTPPPRGRRAAAVGFGLDEIQRTRIIVQEYG